MYSLILKKRKKKDTLQCMVSHNGGKSAPAILKSTTRGAIFTGQKVQECSWMIRITEVSFCLFFFTVSADCVIQRDAELSQSSLTSPSEQQVDFN